MLNHIVIMGRLTRDPELRRTDGGIAVCSFSVAVERDFSAKDTNERDVDFIDCVAWRNTGEFVSKYFSKGRVAVVSGRLQMRRWTDRDGQKRVSAEIVADNVYFGDTKKDGSQGAELAHNPAVAAAQPSPYTYIAPATPPNDFALLEDDDAELPY